MAYGTERVTAIAMAANGTVSIPAGYYVQDLCIIDTNANAVTGGIRIGTTDGGSDVVVAQAVAGNAYIAVADTSILKRVFSLTVATTLYVQAVTLWNGANINVYFICKSLNGT